MAFCVHQIVEEGAWAEGVSTALLKMGVGVLDSAILAPEAMGAVRPVIHPASAGGVLTALSNAAGHDLGRIGRTMAAAEVTPAERRQLRAFLLQVPQLSDCVVSILRSVGQ